MRRPADTAISALTDIDPVGLANRAIGPFNLNVGTGAFSEPFSFSWTNGTTAPNATGIRAGLQHNNPTSSVTPGDGYSFSVPASADLQELTVWVSAHHATGRLTATLGGITQTDLTVAGGQNHGGVYRIQFNGSGAIGETLTVSWTLNSAVNPSVIDESGFASTEANVVIYAAAVRVAGHASRRANPGPRRDWAKRRHPRTAPELLPARLRRT